ncbi:MAG: Autotransporter-associated beta strand repeat protein [Lentisphaerae bacterium ADurb.BinA184]|nr:MAG: Autotransporter-associated beta strand repeat protein [Lentisphaerae bacterium ADurb.BinA184]
MRTRLLTALALFAGWSSLAANLYWDANGTDANTGTTAPGTWGTDTFWNDSSTGTGGTLTATTTSADDLFFSSGTNYTGTFTVTLNGNQNGRSLTVEEGSVTLVGGAANVPTSGTTINAGATLQVGDGGTTGSVSGSIVNNGTYVVNRSSGTFSNAVTGSGDLILTGGSFSFNAGSGFAGTSTIKSGTRVTATNTASFGQNLNAPLTVESGATVVMTGSAGIYLTPVTISGTGVGGLGAIYGNVSNPFLTGVVILDGDALVRNDNSGETIFFNGDVSDVGLTGAGTLTLMGAGGFTFNSGNANNNDRGLITETSSANPVSLVIQGPGTTIINPNANTFTGPVTIDGGTLRVARFADIGANSPIGKGDSTSVATNRASLVFGGGQLRYTQSTNATTDRLFTLGDASGLTGTLSNTGNNYLRFTNTNEIGYGGSGARTLTLTGTSTSTNQFTPVIGDGTGGATSLVKDGSGTWSLMQTSANTYTGGTTVSNGTLEVSASSTLGANVAGNDTVISGVGRLILDAGTNVGGNQAVTFVAVPVPTTGYINGGQPQLTVAYDGALPTFAADSQAGVIALGASYTQELDFSTLPAGMQESFLGASGSASYSNATLTPASDGVYRLGGGGSTLTLTSTGDLITGGGNSLVVGAAGFNGTAPTNGTGGVVLQGANTYTGTTTINPGSTLTVQRGTGTITGSTDINIIGGTLSLQNFPAYGQASDNNNNRIGNSTPVTIERGVFQISGNGTSPGTSETIGDLAFKTTATVTLWNEYGTVALTAAGLSRDGAATGLVRGDRLGVDGATGSTSFAKLVLTDAASVEGIGTTTANTTTGQTTTTNLKVVPWLLADNSRSGTGSTFATYDTGVGLRPLRTGEMVTFAGKTAADQNIKDTGTSLTVNTAETMNSLVLAPTGTATLTGGGTGSLAVTSGGLALVTGQTATLSGFTGLTLGNGASKEAVILVTSGTLAINSPINGGLDYGLTKGGGGTLTLGSANSFTGALVTNAGTLNLRAASTQSGTTINGGTLSLNNTSVGALGGSGADVVIQSGAILSLDNSSTTDAIALGGGDFLLNDGGAIYLYGGGGTRTVFLNKVYVTANGYIRQDSGGGSGNKTLIDEIDMAAGAMLTTLRSNSSTNGFGTDTITLHGDATLNVLANNPDAAHATNVAKITGTGDVTKLGNGELWLAYSGYNNAYSTGAASDYIGDTYVEAGKLRIGMTNALPTGTTLHVNTGATFDLSSGGYENSDANYNQTIAGLNDGATGGGTVSANGTDANLGTTRTLTVGGSGTYSFSGTLVDTSVAYTGSLALAINGGGTQILSGISTATGATTVSNGSTLQLGDGATRNGAVGGAIAVDGTSFLIFSNPLTQTLSSAISGTGAFVKNGAGALTLNGANTFGGTLAVNTGELNLLGTTTTAATVASGAIFSPGGNAGDVTVDALTFNGASIYKWEVSATGTDRILVNGDLTVNGTPTLQLTNLDNTPPPASWAVIEYTGSLLNNAAWTIDYSQTSAGTASNWTDGTGNWDDGANWDQQGWGGGSIFYDTVNKKVMLTGVTASTSTPSSTTDVVIAPAADAAVTGSAAPRTINSLVLGDSSANSHSLTLQAGAPLTTTTTVTVNPSGTLTATAAGLSASHLTVTGTASLGGVIGIPTVSSSGTTRIAAGATGMIAALNVTGGTTTVEAGAAPTLTAVTLSGSANLTAAGGSIGALTLESGYSGTVNVNVGATLSSPVSVPSGTFNYNNGGTLTSLAVNGGSASIDGDSTVATATLATGAALALHDGTIGTIAASTGTIDTYAGATVGTATLTGGGTGAAVDTNGTYLTVTNTLTIKPGTGDFAAAYTGPAGGFGIRGDDLANAATGILLNTAGGKVTLTQQVDGYVAGLDVRAWTTDAGGLQNLEGTPYSLTSPSVTPDHSTPGLGGLNSGLSHMTNAIHWNLNDSQEWASNGGLSAPPYPTDYRTTYAVEYRGLVYIPSDGTYRFATSSDDRSAFWLDPTSDNPNYNDAIVQNRYDQGVTRRQSSQLSLNEGYHEIIVRFTQGGGGHGLYVEWDPTGGTSFADIPGDRFFHGGSVAGPVNMPTTAVTVTATGELALPTGDNHFGTLTLGGAGTNFTLSGATSVTFNGDVVGTGTTAVLLGGPILRLAGTNIDATNPTDSLTLPDVEFSAPAVTVNASGTGTVIFSGDTSFTAQGASLTVGGGLLQVDGTLGDVALAVLAGARLGGIGTIGSVIDGAGSVDPGNDLGLLTAVQADPTGGLDYNFEFTMKNGEPNWAEVENDVFRLTDASTPFMSALDGDNTISLYLEAALFASLLDGDELYGGFYTDAGDPLASLEDAVLDVYYEDAGGSVTYNGVTYSPLTDPLASFTLGTVANAEFAAGGYLTVFSYSGAVIPEPASLVLLALAGVAGVRRPRRR